VRISTNCLSDATKPFHSADSSNLADDDGDDRDGQVSAPHVNDEPIQALSPLRRLSKVFLEPPVDEHVHVIVTRPPSLSIIEGVYDEKDDIVTALIKSKFSPPYSNLGFLPDVVQGMTTL
jgi:hypothetical protein